MMERRTLLCLLLVFLTGCVTGDPGTHPTSTVSTLISIMPKQIKITHFPTATPLPSPTYTQQVITTATVDPGMNDLANYYGGLMVTLDYAGDTLTILNIQAFILQLGDRFIWTVKVEPPDRLTLNRKITPEPGEQGVYVARNKGHAIISAIGEPVCRQQEPPCNYPDVFFQMIVEIQ